jgi:hypothetical protein
VDAGPDLAELRTTSTRATLAADAPSTNGADGETCDQSRPAAALAIRRAPPLAAEKIPYAVPIDRPGTWSATHALATPSVAAT